MMIKLISGTVALLVTIFVLMDYTVQMAIEYGLIAGFGTYALAVLTSIGIMASGLQDLILRE